MIRRALLESLCAAPLIVGCGSGSAIVAADGAIDASCDACDGIRAGHVTVDVTPGHARNSISPLRAMNAAIDRDPLDSVDTIFHSPDLDAMLSAGWGSVSYRLNTELGVSAWHWNPAGLWSDPSGAGYFVGAATTGASIERSFGYTLPHNGMTGSFLGYGVLDDGRSETYWKTNPYLSSRYTHESDTLHPQWVMADLGSKTPIDAIRIAWADPFAVVYDVEYWTGDDALYDPAHGAWSTFPGGAVTKGAGGTVTLTLAPKPVHARFVRVSMKASSATCDTHGASDPRNCVGFAMAELSIGSFDDKHHFVDVVHHSPDGRQTAMYTSSTDSWHRTSDIDRADGEQPGFDLVYRSGITRGMPMTVPVAMLYDNPDSAANEIAYLEARNYPIRYVELGEEPDGQWVLPEDDAALYVQWADAIHAVDPKIALAGPVFQGVNDDIPTWPDAAGDTSWFERFLSYLRSHGHLNDLAVMTFEHYPYNPCVTWPLLYREPELITHIMNVWKKDGLPSSVPMEVTESNLAWNAGTQYMTPFAALWLADYAGAFLTAGGQALYYYQYEPLPMYDGCGWGTFGMFNVDAKYDIQQHTAQFYAARLLTQEWAQPVDRTHAILPATADVVDAAGHSLVTAYAIERPDALTSVLLVNKDEHEPHSVTVAFADGSAKTTRSFQGRVTQISFGSDQYTWEPNGAKGSANPDEPATTSIQAGGPGAVFSLPTASITVLRGTVK